MPWARHERSLQLAQAKTEATVRTRVLDGEVATVHVGDEDVIGRKRDAMHRAIGQELRTNPTSLDHLSPLSIAGGSGRVRKGPQERQALRFVGLEHASEGRGCGARIVTTITAHGHTRWCQVYDYRRTARSQMLD